MALVERVGQSCKKIGNECKKIKSMLFNWQLQMLYNNDCWCLLWDQHINIAQIKKNTIFKFYIIKQNILSHTFHSVEKILNI